MKLKILFFIFWFFPILTFGQKNIDSLLQVWENTSNVAAIRVGALHKICDPDFIFSKPDSAFHFAELAYSFSKSKGLEKEMETSLTTMKLASEIKNLNKKNQQSRQRERFLLIGGLALLLFALGYFSRKRQTQLLLEKNNSLREIEILKEKLSTRSVASTTVRKELTLDKEKIEKAINAKLGESSWMILNLIFKNPSISNKELADSVSLSLEGVSSSLRRMYTAFEISASSNKKITLIMKATKISVEEY